MSRRLAVCGIACSIIVMGILGWQLPVVGGAEVRAGSLDAMTIDNKDYKSDRKGPVAFSHRKHAMDYRVSCWDCHHEFKDGKNVWSPWEKTAKCIQCHDPDKSQDKVMNLQKAYHVNCKNCHQNLAGQKKRTGPYKKCFGCHKEESPKK